jgi:hypothetical protein
MHDRDSELVLEEVALQVQPNTCLDSATRDKTRGLTVTMCT